jgi:hypothetical protein
MQGMESVLQQPSAPAAVEPIPTPVDVSVAPGVKFEPGQQPKNLAGEISAPNLEASVSADNSVPAYAPGASEVFPSDQTPVASPPSSPSGKKFKSSKTTSSASGNCQPRVENWTKTCVEAGYPESFTGKITGETRTVCPDNELQDVWIANSCAPPEEASATTAAAPPTAEATTDVVLPTTSASTAVAAPVPVQASAPKAVVRTNTVSSTARADASCGPANGLATNSAPAVDLCVFGDASEVSGDGPWRWNCKGLSGGMTVSCAAPVSAAAVAAKTSAPVYAPSTDKVPPAAAVAEDGLCGSSDGMGVDHAPSSNLCAKGAVSRVNGSGPWTWACSGQNGGAAAACSAARKVDGVCGAAGRTGSDQMPMHDLCTAGYASAVTGEGPWNWTCSGLYGGSPATCSAAPKQDAVCGNASLSGHHEAPHDNLCSVGTPGSVHGSGPWSWNCNGSNGGSPVSCTGPMSINGMCGNANGVAVVKAPSTELCAHGHGTALAATVAIHKAAQRQS